MERDEPPQITSKPKTVWYVSVVVRKYNEKVVFLRLTSIRDASYLPVL